MKSCKRCFTHRKRCIPVAGSTICERCTRIGVPQDCVVEPRKKRRPRLVTAVPPSQSSPPQTFVAQTSAQTLNTTPSPSPDFVADFGAGPVVAKIMNAFDGPLPLASHNQSDTWTVEDPDLMATWQDYWLAHSDLTSNGTSPPTAFSIDGDNLLQSFWTKPPLLRLIFCALCSHTLELPENVALSYYKRARKAFVRAECLPSLETVQSLYFLYLFSVYKGQPVIGRQFLKAGLLMIKELQMDLDPESSPVFQCLTSRQKEERRRGFWALYWFLKWEQALTFDTIQMPDIAASKMNNPSEIVEDGRTIFLGISTIRHECDIFDIIADIKRYNATPPQSIAAFFTEEALHLNNRLVSTHSQLPITLLLYSESSHTITPQDVKIFQTQFSTVPARELYAVFSWNLYALSSISILHRPRLFLSALPSCRPQYLDKHPGGLPIIIQAITQCLDAAHRIVSLLEFAIDPSCPIKNLTSPYCVYPAFEAVTVLWFLICRMETVWIECMAGKGGVEGLIGNLGVVRKRISQLIEFGKTTAREEGTKSGTMDPLIRCMEEMLREIDVRSGDRVREDSGVEDVELGMKVMSLGDNVGASTDNQVLSEPWACMGLLGLEVGSGIRWKGRSEDSWRLFWKLNS